MINRLRLIFYLTFDRAKNMEVSKYGFACKVITIETIVMLWTHPIKWFFFWDPQNCTAGSHCSCNICYVRKNIISFKATACVFTINCNGEATELMFTCTFAQW